MDRRIKRHENRYLSGNFYRMTALLCALALIWSGGLIWIDNSLAIIPDNDPASHAQFDLLDALHHGPPI